MNPRWSLQIVGLVLVLNAECAADVRIIAKTGDPAPDGNGFYHEFFGASFNNAGQLAFVARMSATAQGAFDDTALIVRGPASARVLSREGDPSLGPTTGRFTGHYGLPSINSNGDVAIRHGFLSLGGGADLPPGVVVFRNGAPSLLAAARTDTPNGLDEYVDFGDVAMNDAGQIVSRMIFKSGAEAYARLDGGVLEILAPIGGMSPGALGDDWADRPTITGDGSATFRGQIVMDDGSLGVVTILQAGDHGLRVIEGHTPWAQNERGDTLHAPNAQSDPGGAALVLTDAMGAVLPVLAASNSLPRFRAQPPMSPFALNNEREFAFLGLLEDGQDEREAIFALDGGGDPTPLLVAGAPLLGSTIQTFSELFEPHVFELNDHGALAFWARLADGREVLATIQIPAPGGAMLAPVVMVLAARVRRRGLARSSR